MAAASLFGTDLVEVILVNLMFFSITQLFGFGDAQCGGMRSRGPASLFGKLRRGKGGRHESFKPALSSSDSNSVFNR